MSGNIEKETLMVDWPVWTMMASWVGSLVDNLKKKGCMAEDAADLMNRNLTHGVILATEAVNNKDAEKMHMARDIIIGVMDSVLTAFNSCINGGGKA